MPIIGRLSSRERASLIGMPKIESVRHRLATLHFMGMVDYQMNRSFYQVCWPELFNVLVHVDENELFTADRIFQLFRKFCHCFVVWEYDKLNLIVFKGKVIGYAPLSFMCVVNSLTFE